MAELAERWAERAQGRVTARIFVEGEETVARLQVSFLVG